jgi:hypothetical protein
MADKAGLLEKCGVWRPAAYAGMADKAGLLEKVEFLAAGGDRGDGRTL